MATLSHAMAVKSLNRSCGRRRFVFKTFSQRIEEIDIDVYRSLDTLKDEPSEGSSFFRDCLVEYRELNTAEDFISFYEEMLPLVQTLPQIILHKEMIVSNLLSRLKLTGRLSNEPILRLMAALSRDLLEDFIPFLQRFADSLEYILESGADRDPEIIEQIFTSWSCIMMYLQKYLIDNVFHFLRITAKLRYYRKDYVREFMAESMSFLLRKTPVQKLKAEIRKVMTEVVEEPSETRKSSVGALLAHVVRITPSRLHSRAEALLPLLVDEYFFEIGDQRIESASIALEVVCMAFRTLHAELHHVELAFVMKCVYTKLADSATHTNIPHLSRLLSLLLFMLQHDNLGIISDYIPMLGLVDTLLPTFILPDLTLNTLDRYPEVIDKIFGLMLCILDGLSDSKNKLELLSVASQWGPIFNLRSQCLVTFIKELLKKDQSIVHVFGTYIISSFNNLVEISEEEAVFLMVKFCEKLDGEGFNFLDGKFMEKLSRVQDFFKDTLCYWIGRISKAAKGILVMKPFQQSKLAVLWGVIGCYCHFADGEASLSILMDLIEALDRILMVEYSFTGCQEDTWHTLIGAALRSYHKLACVRDIPLDNSCLTTILDLAKRYKSSHHILTAVADILDSIMGSEVKEDGEHQIYLPENVAGKGLDALNLFGENLCHANKEMRLSTLRILCRYDPLYTKLSANEFFVDDRKKTDASVISDLEDKNINVLNLLRSVEETSLSIATTRKVVLVISDIQISLSTRRVTEQYLPAVLGAIIGILHNRFSYLWSPASECLAILVGQYFGMLWDVYIMHLDHCQSLFLKSRDQLEKSNLDCNMVTGLVGIFNSEVSTFYDSTPSATVLSLLIQSLQKVPSLVESHTKPLIILFLKFLGYNVNELTSVALYTLDCERKEWRRVLQEWLSLFILLRNPKSFYQSDFIKDILQHRLLEENDADIQLKVIDCLLIWKDDFLLPYSQNLKNLINAKYLREELTRWSLSRNSLNSIDMLHRAFVVPIVIRILTPKVRNLRMLAGQKCAKASHRKAVLGFLAQLDVNELSLFFCLLIKPLLSLSRLDYETDRSLCNLTRSLDHVVDASNLMNHFTVDSIKSITWEKKFGFLHVVENILAVFDESQLNPFLDLLANCAVRILASCTSILDSAKSNESFTVLNPSSDADVAEYDDTKDQVEARTVVKQCKDLRSLCLKIMYMVLSKYDYHDFGVAFWDLFFTSIKPLTANFKQEGASSKRPSSLFFCFIAMSKSYRLVPLLHKDDNIVSDIFSMLTHPSACEPIVSCVFKFIKNLMKLDSELTGEDCSVKRLFLPHLDLLISSLHSFFTSEKSNKSNSSKFINKRAFTIFSLLSKFIQEPSAAEMFVDMLLPLLTKRRQNFDISANILQIIQEVVKLLEREGAKKVIHSVTPLLISAGLTIRNVICDVLDALAVKDSSFLAVAKIIRELNATSQVEIDCLDYDRVICSYEKITKDFFYTIEAEHALLILAHSIQDMSSEELILRQSAFSLLLTFIEFCGEIIDGYLNSNEVWSGTVVQHLVNKFLLKYMGSAMEKEGPVQKVWIDLLREMVLRLPNVANLNSFKALYSDDAEQDFFSNIVHLQKHRRARALSRFRNTIITGELSEVIMNKVFVPLIFGMLFNVQDGKDEHIRRACLDTLAAISGCMNWNKYYALLTKIFRFMRQKPGKQNILLRLISSILDNFHFPEVSGVSDTVVPACDTHDPYTIDSASFIVAGKSSSSIKLHVIQMSLQKNLLPRIQKLLISDSDKVNVTISLVALKLLKLLPSEVMESQLSTIVHRISNFLKNRLVSVRDEARSALAACLKELGLEYLQFIIRVLKGTLKRGYELHVLGYTLNFLLSKFLLNSSPGMLDYCLDDLLRVVENDILGDVSEEKEVEKIASKMKETKKQKSFETLELISRNITFRSQALKLLSPFTGHMQKQLTQKVKSKLENIFSSISAGIEHNSSVDQTELFVFTYGLIEDGVKNENDWHHRTLEKIDESCTTSYSNIFSSVDIKNSHLITTFALGIFQNQVKNLKLNKEDVKSLSLLDPFINLLGQCLTSKHTNITTAAIRCLTPLVSLPLPSLVTQSDKIKNSLLVIARSSVNASSQLMESCIKLLTTLLRSTRITLSADQLRMLIQFPLFLDLAKNPTFVALSLLKAIVHRKLVVPEVYDVVQIVATLMVQSQHEQIRKKCGEILLQFLLGYHLSEKRLQQHIDFLLTNLRYQHSNGREAVLEMLHAIIMKFPQNVVDELSQTLFVHLVVSLANDDDRKVSSMTAAVVKCLLGHVNSNSLRSLLEYSLTWYFGGKQNLLGAAAQVLGLFVEANGKDFEKNLGSVIPEIRRIFQAALLAVSNQKQYMEDEPVVPFWKEAYYSLVLFEKILHQFRNLCFDRDLEDIWEIICQFLLHPHLWLRSISNRLLSLYFALVDTQRKTNELSTNTFFLLVPSVLFSIAASLCSQLLVPLNDDATVNLITQNLVFSLSNLHSILDNNKCAETCKFWSRLDNSEQSRFLKAFVVLDSGRGSRILEAFTSDVSVQHYPGQHPFISYLLQKMGKMCIEMEATQMKIVFSCFKLISSDLLGCQDTLSIGNNEHLSYAYQMMLPLYRVCEGYFGKVVSDDLKQLAQEVREHIRGVMGSHFVQVYSLIRKNIKGKRDKRKQDEKIMAVVNPERNAKRKLRIAAKHRSNKKRKIMSMKMGRWMR